ncbi:hypothetical protein D3C85_1402910 [compost metagenome]
MSKPGEPSVYIVCLIKVLHQIYIGRQGLFERFQHRQVNLLCFTNVLTLFLSGGYKQATVTI